MNTSVKNLLKVLEFAKSEGVVTTLCIYNKGFNLVSVIDSDYITLQNNERLTAMIDNTILSLDKPLNITWDIEDDLEIFRLNYNNDFTISFLINSVLDY